MVMYGAKNEFWFLWDVYIENLKVQLTWKTLRFFNFSKMFSIGFEMVYTG